MSKQALSNSLFALSPLDGRYSGKVTELTEYFSEYALIKYRVLVEVDYLLALIDYGPLGIQISDTQRIDIQTIKTGFDLEAAERVKKIEAEINHDVKAIEYYIKEQLEKKNLGELKEWVHFGLTSQDINNTANPLMTGEAVENIVLPQLSKLIDEIEKLGNDWMEIPMLARTHGQPASPTKLGKEIMVFHYRLSNQKKVASKIPMRGKFGGATGNFNAHHVAFPDFNWAGFADRFLSSLGLVRQPFTTQIENYDTLAALFQSFERINTILIDFCRDIWHYISIDYIKQRTIKNEVGSSAMPHKVNPIDFENAEGNLGLANSLFHHLASKLPISRLQRDLTDSTVLRNVGIPFANSLLSYKSILKGISKLEPNEKTLRHDLDQNWMIISEAIQSILRREGFQNPYEKLKDLTRGNSQIGKEEIHDFIEQLDVSENVKLELKGITPENYLGIYLSK